MPDYKCPYCDYETPKKSLIKKHLTKKKLCDHRIEIMDIEKYLRNDQKEFPCRYCEKSFAHQSTMYHHQKRCNNQTIKKIEKDDEKSTNDMENIKQQLEWALLEIQNLKKTNTSQVIINKNKTVINNNYTLNSFSSNSFEPTQEEVLRLIQIPPIRLIKKLVEEKHFNKNYPERMNFYISNYKDNIARVFDGENWGMKNADHVTEDIHTIFNDGLDDQIDDLDDEEEEKYQELIKRWISMHEKRGFVENLRKELKEFIYSKKDLVMKIHGIKR